MRASRRETQLRACRRIAETCALTLILGSAHAQQQPPTLGTLKNLRLGMTMAEANRADETAACHESKGRTASCLLFITVAQVPSKVVLELVTTAPRAEMAAPKAPIAPRYEVVPTLTSSDRRNGVTTVPGAAETIARNVERQRGYGDRIKVYEAAKREAQSRFETQFKVAKIHVSFGSDRHGSFRQAYIAKFGRPATSKLITYRNAMNAAFEGTEDHWEDAVADVTLYQRCESTVQSCLVIESADLAPYMLEASKAAVRDRVQDL